MIDGCVMLIAGALYALSIEDFIDRDYLCSVMCLAVGTLNLCIYIF